MKKVVLLTIGLLMVCNCAFATITPLGTLGSATTPFSAFHAVYGDFTDYFSFNLTGASNVMTFASWIDAEIATPMGTWKFNIDDLDITLYSNSLFSDKDKINPLSVSGTDNSLTYFFNSLLPGMYYFSVTGTVPQTFTGSYVGLASASQVPVPAAALLLGAGLLGIVGIRRKQSV